MKIKNQFIFYLANDPGETLYECRVRDAASNTLLQVLPENSKVVLFAGKQDILYYNIDNDPVEVDRLETDNVDASLDANDIVIGIPPIQEVNKFVEIEMPYLSHSLPFRLQSANSSFVLGYYETEPNEDEYDIIHKFAVINNGTASLESNNEKLVYIFEPAPPRGTIPKVNYTTNHNTNPIETSNIVTISTTETAYAIAIEYIKR